ncbi:MAG: DUF11 domain-containing protein [Sphingopyxis sp.]|nr:DUF11 domain-containing protein [Sphingopyxis sp.]
MMTAFAVGAAQPAAAQGTGSVTSKVELEKSTAATNGKPARTTYVTPDMVVPGDRVRVTIIFTNNGAAPATGVKLDNAIPRGLTFDGTADTAGFSVSTDGGTTFAPLAALRIPVNATSQRPAVAGDVTHARWLWPDAIAPGKSRSVAFFGRVK